MGEERGQAVALGVQAGDLLLGSRQGGLGVREGRLGLVERLPGLTVRCALGGEVGLRLVQLRRGPAGCPLRGGEGRLRRGQFLLQAGDPGSQLF